MATETKDKLINAESIKAMYEYFKSVFATKREMELATKKDTCFSETTRKLLIDVLKNAVYNDDVSENIQNLNVALGGNIIHSIRYNLKNIISNTTLLEIEDDEKYTCTLTTNENCTFKKVIILMDGVDITDDVYNNGKIVIEHVTGNVKIVASAIDNTLIPVTLTQGRIKDLYPYIDENVKNRVSYVDNRIKLSPESTYEIVGQEGVRYGVQQILTTGAEAYYSNTTMPDGAKIDSGWQTSGYRFTPEANVLFAFFTASYANDGEITPEDAMPLYIREV